jgi:hypothetical protein
MNFRQLLNVPFAVFIMFLFANLVWGQESDQTEKQKKSSPPKLMLRLSDQDVILPITSIEWGTPDRWSFTSRYVHMFEKDRDNKTWLNNITVTLSPGISGGRFGIGYQGILSRRSTLGFTLLSEARIVLLRTWGNPLSAVTDRTYLGAEIRSSFSWLINLGVGYYSQISSTDNHSEHFYGFHIGVGI